MSKFGTKTLAIVSVLMALPANAQVGGPSNDTLKADMLYSVCNPPAGIDKATLDSYSDLCEIYFRGLTDGLFMMRSFIDNGNGGCLPTDTPISNAEAKGDFELFLRDHPEAAKNSAAAIASIAIMRAHPCPK